MKAHDFIKAWGGELLLLALAGFKLLSSFPGLRYVYHVLLIRLVENTGLFDEAFYRENNPDIAEAEVGGLSHYVVYGDKEGRSPMPFFDPQYYRQMSGSWKKNLNALLHYSYVGRFRRLSPSPWFDVKYYMTQNKDVARAGLDPIVHYMEWGGIEGRWPCPHFDSAYYLRSNPDVCDLNINPLLHYLRYGRREGRRCLPESTENNGVLIVGERPKPVLPSEEEWAALVPHSPNAEAAVDVIVPVYRGLAETLRCIYSVLSAKCDIEYQLVVINDASPEDELVEALERLAEKGLFTLVSNDDNLGFVRTANRGMQLHSLRDVVLLNSDTEVYDRWLDRLRAAAKRNAQTGTLTPLSNNATICSYPYFPDENPFPLELEYHELDGLLSELNAGVEVEAPTGVGFCMYIKRRCIKDVGLFDEKTFGKGYGEENDFCQRAIKKGWRNVIATDVFVRHFGSVSFQGEKALLASNALKKVEKKHPNYLPDVANFIQRKPLAEIYRQIDWARLLRLKREKNVLLICHERGGGTEKRLQEDIDYFAEAGYGIYLLRPVAGEPDKVCLSHPQAKWLPNLATIDWRDTEALKLVVRELGITEVVSHSFVDWIKEAPACLSRLVTETKLEWKMHLHDYEMICPRINLVDDDGYYCKEPDEGNCNKCLKTCGSSYGDTEIGAWRALHRAAMKRATTILVPDQDVKDRLARYYPDVNLEVRPHELMTAEEVTPKPFVVKEDEKLRVVVIGAINNMKGFTVLLRCAKDAAARKLPLKFMLLGYSMNDRALEEVGVEVTGKYQESEALARLNSMTPHLVWIPSVWPETYCYTLSIGLKGNYPVMAFDTGAVSRRIREFRDDTYILPLALAKRHSEVNAFLMYVRDCAMVQDQAAEDGATDYAVAVGAYD